jgi:hypothetical protein
MKEKPSKIKRDKPKPKYEEGPVPGSIIMPRKYKIIKSSVFLIVIGLVFILFPIINMIGPWLANPGLKGPYLSWTLDPRTTMTISWQTPEKCNSILDFGLATETDFTNTTTNATESQFHSITLTGLDPNTRYKYRIRTTTLENFWGLDKTYTFTTAINSSEAFKFVIYGDNRPGTFKENAHPSVVNAIRSETDSAFTINVGDLVHRPRNLAQWDRFFWEIKDLAATKPYLTSLGNHEYDEGNDPDYGANYFQFLYLPQPEWYYSFNYSNAHFISLNLSTNHIVFSQTELNWLKNDLQKIPADMWKIVYFHVPPYSSGAHGNNQIIIDEIVPILEQYNAVVIAGHDHNYEHLFVNKTHYVVTGGGGSPLEVGLIPGPNTVYLEITFCYTLVDINGANMSVITKRPDGSIVDQFEIGSYGVIA